MFVARHEDQVNGSNLITYGPRGGQGSKCLAPAPPLGFTVTDHIISYHIFSAVILSIAKLESSIIVVYSKYLCTKCLTRRVVVLLDH